MVRKYTKRRPWGDKDKRMARVAELRAMGWSLRRIADRLVVSHQTVANDLARWDRERPNVTPLGVKNAVSNLAPPPAATKGDLTPEFDTPDTNVIRIRRSS